MMGTRYFPWEKQPGHGVDHPHSSNAEVKERDEIYLPPVDLHSLFYGELYLYPTSENQDSF
jgi:hypothetical protein